jgi:hypothetical protein
LAKDVKELMDWVRRPCVAIAVPPVEG